MTTEPVTADPVHHGQADRWGGWTWRDPSHGEHFRTCSYCGSVNPDDLAAEQTWRAEWADQKYGWPHKFYVDIPNRDPDALFAIGSTNSDRPGFGSAGPGGLTWVAVADLTPEQRAIMDRDRMLDEHVTFIGFGTRPNHHGKFYTTHLADPALAVEAKTAIERRSGLQFQFTDGRVTWSSA